MTISTAGLTALTGQLTVSAPQPSRARFKSPGKSPSIIRAEAESLCLVDERRAALAPAIGRGRRRRKQCWIEHGFECLQQCRRQPRPSLQRRPQYRVVTFAVAIVNPSDFHLKTDIAQLENGAAIIDALEPVYYRKKAEPERRQLGLIAQDVQLILPEVVYETAEESEDGDAILGTDYVKLVPVLISAIRELNAKVANMERRIRR